MHVYARTPPVPVDGCMDTDAVVHYTQLAAESPRDYGCLVKICFVGGENSGKTALVNRIVCNSFTDKKTGTGGVAYAIKYLWFGSVCVKLLAVDTSNPARFLPVIGHELTKCDGVVVVCDLSSGDLADRLDDALRLVENTPAYLHGNVLLAGNKADTDVPSRELHVCAVNERADARTLAYRECSAKTGIGTDTMICDLIELVLSHRKQTDDAASAGVVTLWNDDANLHMPGDGVVWEHAHCNPCQC